MFKNDKRTVTKSRIVLIVTNVNNYSVLEIGDIYNKKKHNWQRLPKYKNGTYGFHN